MTGGFLMCQISLPWAYGAIQNNMMKLKNVYMPIYTIIKREISKYNSKDAKYSILIKKNKSLCERLQCYSNCVDSEKDSWKH